MLGKHVPLYNIADESAKFLATQQWGIQRTANTTPTMKQRHKETVPTTRVIYNTLDFNTTEITVAELKRTIRQIKRRKAPGPDNIPMEIFKEMN